MHNTYIYGMDTAETPESRATLKEELYRKFCEKERLWETSLLNRNQITTIISETLALAKNYAKPLEASSDKKEFKQGRLVKRVKLVIIIVLFLWHSPFVITESNRYLGMVGAWSSILVLIAGAWLVYRLITAPKDHVLIISSKGLVLDKNSVSWVHILGTYMIKRGGHPFMYHKLMLILDNGRFFEFDLLPFANRKGKIYEEISAYIEYYKNL